MNLKSPNYFNTVLGHEVTHFLEGTGKHYEALQKAIFKYAQTKGDYEGRRKTLETLYKNIDGTSVDYELTADLVGDYLFTEYDFIKSLSTENRNLFQRIYGQIKYMFKLATAGSKEARELEKVMHNFEKALRESTKESKRASEKTQFSLTIKHTNGTIEELADARGVTYDKTIEYLEQAKSGELKWNTYIPVRKDTPQVIIDTLMNVGENVENRSLVMQVRKAQQAMSDKNKGGKTALQGSNKRSHALSPREVVEIINNLNSPNAIILQTNRRNANGEPLPNNVAVFVEYNKNGKESVAVIEFESSIDPEFIGTEFGETNYHTVVTVFEPDTVREGMEFDYVEELLSNPNNYELEIVRRQSAESAIGKKHPNTLSEPPSDNSIAPPSDNVNNNFSLSDNIGNQLTDNQNPTDDPDIRYSLSLKNIDIYSKEEYNNFGWARNIEAISKNELDDMYSKVQGKGSLKKFPQSGYGEAIIEVNDKAHTTLGTDNVFAFVTGTKNNPQITKVVRFQVETETEMEIIKENLYERGSFSYTYYSYLKEEGLAREYSKKSAVDYNRYKEEKRSRSSRDNRNGTDRDSGNEQNGRRTFKETQSNDIGPIKEASSTDGVFFDGENTKQSLSLEGEQRKLGGSYRFDGKDFGVKADEDIGPVREMFDEYIGPVAETANSQTSVNSNTQLPMDDIGPVKETSSTNEKTGDDIL